MVNGDERRLSTSEHGLVTEDTDLVGLDYLWRTVLLAPYSISFKAIECLKNIYTNLSKELQQDKVL